MQPIFHIIDYNPEKSFSTEEDESFFSPVFCKKINLQNFNSMDKSLMRALVVISSACKGKRKQLTPENHLLGPASD